MWWFWLLERVNDQWNQTQPCWISATSLSAPLFGRFYAPYCPFGRSIPASLTNVNPMGRKLIKCAYLLLFFFFFLVSLAHIFVLQITGLAAKRGFIYLFCAPASQRCNK